MSEIPEVPQPLRKPNPLLNPADEVLRCAVEIETLHAFQVITTWIKTCLSTEVWRLPNIKDDVDYRHAQGRAQALLLINKALTQGREELKTREANARERLLNRNV